LKGPVTASLSRADLALGRLDGAVETLPHPELFTAMYVRREAVLSSQIEGTQASLDDLVAAEARLRGDKPLGDVNEVINYTAALNFGIARLAELPLSGRLLREIHEILMTGVRGGHATPGAFRTTQNWIGAAGATLSDAIFVPPPPETVPDQIGALENFLHQPSDLPLLVQVGLAHAQFETIHPFVDGNGRLGRLLITFLLCERSVLSKPVLYVSLTLKKRRQEYYERLQAVRDRGAWEDWLIFFLDCVAEAALDAARLAKNILSLREAHRDSIVNEMGARAGKAIRLLERLYRDPYIEVNEAVTMLGVSYANANTIVWDMERLGILREATGQQRNRIFVYEDYIALFREL
jgi:Fic family protein